MGIDPKTLRGVLLDFDLVRVIPTAKSTAVVKDRSGTVPYMAIEFLTDEYWRSEIERLYCHDLESFIWVIAHIAWGFDSENNPVPNSPVQGWIADNYQLCAAAKSHFVLRRPQPASSRLKDDPVKTMGESCIEWLDGWLYWRRKHSTASDREALVEDFGGAISDLLGWPTVTAAQRQEKILPDISPGVDVAVAEPFDDKSGSMSTECANVSKVLESGIRYERRGCGGGYS
jgi:hypothetical protein